MNKHLKLVVNNSNNNEKSNYFFEKDELKIILDLYAKMVSNGSWKDYGLKISSKQVAFSVFKNSSENAVYNICKNFKVWGLLPITFIFTAFQIKLINKYKTNE